MVLFYYKKTIYQTLILLFLYDYLDIDISLDRDRI